METPKPVAMLDPPGPLDTLEKWEQYLDLLRGLPDNAANKDALIVSAKKYIALLWGCGPHGQSEAIALTNPTIGGQSVLHELFRKQLGCSDKSIRKLELTYFAAWITTAVYLRSRGRPNREQILDVFAKCILEGSITASEEQISFGSAVAEYRGAVLNMIGC